MRATDEGPVWPDALGAELVGPALLAAVGVLAHLRHHEVEAAAALALALVSAHGMVLSARFRGTVAGLVQRVGHLVGRVISTVLLTPVFAFASTVGVGARLGARWLGRPAGAGWVLASSSDPATAARRPFGRERAEVAMGAPGGPGRGNRRWIVRRTVLRTVAALLVVEAVGVVAYVQLHRSPTSTYGGVSAPASGALAALAGEPWAQEAGQDNSAAALHQVYTSFLGTSIQDFSSRYVNVHDRVRASWTAPAGAGRPLDVWFFGASAMFGFDYQRDDHTIASDLVRIASQHGISIRASNYGSPGYVDYAEVLLLEQLLATGKRPDLVVFFDGINDEEAQIFNVVDGTATPGEPTGVTAAATADELAAQFPGASTGAPSPLAPPRIRSRPLSSGAIVDATRSVMQQGIDLTRLLGQHDGFSSTFFWQPTIYSRRPLDPGERRRLRELDIDTARYVTMQRIDQQVRAGLPAGVVDLGGALDHVTGPIFTDQVHTNEPGAQAVAEAMFANLEPRLRALVAASGGTH